MVIAGDTTSVKVVLATVYTCKRNETTCEHDLNSWLCLTRCWRWREEGMVNYQACQTAGSKKTEFFSS